MNLRPALSAALSAALLTTIFSTTVHAEDKKDLFDRVAHHYVKNGDVKIHYVTAGKGPVVVMIHGFPDFWYTWRHQMGALEDNYQVVALDLRGYNRSDKPKGVESYDMKHLVEDVVAVIKDRGVEKATVVGHDWGGAVAWSVAMMRPEVVDKLVILNLPHPRGLMRELANNPAQQRNSQYARNFQKPDAHKKLTATGLALWVKDPAAKKRYVEAFERSDFEAMLNYYKQNYPREPYDEAKSTLTKGEGEDGAIPPKVKAPVLMFHGLKDWALLPGALNDTWKWIDNELTLMTIPNAGHFVQQDAPEKVSRTMRSWLDDRR